MAEVIQQIRIDETDYPIGAHSKNVVYGNTTVEAQLQTNINNINNKADKTDVYTKAEVDNKILDIGGSGGVPSTDLVVDNSLTVNGYVIEGKGHSYSNIIFKPIFFYDYQPTVNTNSTNITINEVTYDTMAYFNSGEAYNFIVNNGNVIKNNQYYYGKMIQTSDDGGEIEVEGYFHLIGGCGASIAFYYNAGNYYYNNYISSLQVAVTYDINHIQGKYSIIDKDYAHIVGGGTSDSDRKNIHTLDWEGNAMFAGDITFMYNGQLTSLSSILNHLES